MVVMNYLAVKFLNFSEELDIGRVYPLDIPDSHENLRKTITSILQGPSKVSPKSVWLFMFISHVYFQTNLFRGI